MLNPRRGRIALVAAFAVCLGVFLMAVATNTHGLRRAFYLDRRVHGVTLPEPGSVVQAGPDGTARVKVAGRIGWLAKGVEAGIDANGDGMIEPSDWKPFAAPRLTYFEGEATVRTGWARVLLRASQPANAVTFNHVAVAEVGVGEVFIIVGQSNAGGSCRNFFLTKSANVRNGQVQEDGSIVWKSGADPQVLNGGGSVWPLVGDELSKRLGDRPIGFINVAVGSTSMRDWAPSTPNFRRLVTAMRAIAPNGARAILWQQGESDNTMPEDEYHQRLTTLIREFEKAVGGKPRWMVATGTFVEGKPAPNLRAALKRVQLDGLALEGPDLDPLGAEYRQSDEVHFNPEGTRAAARLWTEKLMSTFYGEGNAGR